MTHGKTFEHMFHREDIAAGIGYSDGLVRETKLPKLWHHWGVKNKVYYVGGYQRGWVANWTQFWRKATVV